jgi:hypothetical protein
MEQHYHVIIVHPFTHHQTGKNYVKGQMVTDPDEVEMLHEDKEHHFIRIAAPTVAPEAFSGVADEVPTPVPVADKSVKGK